MQTQHRQAWLGRGGCPVLSKQTFGSHQNSGSPSEITGCPSRPAGERQEASKAAALRRPQRCGTRCARRPRRRPRSSPRRPRKCPRSAASGRTAPAPAADGPPVSVRSWRRSSAAGGGRRARLVHGVLQELRERLRVQVLVLVVRDVRLLVQDVVEAGRPLARAQARGVAAVVDHERDAARVHVRVERVDGLRELGSIQRFAVAPRSRARKSGPRRKIWRRASMIDSLQISEYGWPCSRSTSTVAIMVATYTPAVKGLSGISDSTRCARTFWPTCARHGRRLAARRRHCRGRGATTSAGGSPPATCASGRSCPSGSGRSARPPARRTGSRCRWRRRRRSPRRCPWPA